MSYPNLIIQAVRPLVDKFPSIANTYRNYRDGRFLLTEPHATSMGFKFIGNKSMENGAFQQDETSIINRLLDDADIFINIGANIGYYCCHALARGKYTIAFEPIAINLHYLMKNVSANGWQDNVEIFPLALTDTSGIITIYGGGTSASLIRGWAGISPNYASLVSCSTLDKVVGGRFEGADILVVMDVEGAELSVLRGALKLLEQNPKPTLMVEVTISEQQPEGVRVNPKLSDTFRLFWDRGYEAWTATRTPRQVHPAEVDAIAAGGPDTLGVHNYLFMDKGRTPPAWT